MPIEIRELVIKATVSDRDADGATSETADTISEDQREEDVPVHSFETSDWA